MRAHLAPGAALLLGASGLWSVGCADNSLGVYNTPPSAAITSPAGGELYGAGELIEFFAVARDSQDAGDALEITWSSDQDGVISEEPADVNGDVYFATSGLSSGDHAITLTVVDTNGESATASVGLKVGQGTSTEGAPTVILIGPAEGEELMASEGITVIGTMTDDEQTWDSLEAVISSSRDGNIWVGSPDTNGTVSVADLVLSEGQHTLRLTAQDDDGLTSYDEVGVTVLADGRPEALITAPSSGLVFSTETTLLEGMVSDRETDTEDLQVIWESDIQGTLASGNPDSSGYTAHGANLAVGTHVVTLNVFDEDAKEGSDSVTLEVVHPDDYDADGDGYTPNEGDCDDSDNTVSPGETDTCDDLDNDCSGYVNDPYWDSYEQNDSSSTYYDLGEVDDSLWAGQQVTISGLTLHEDDDDDWFRWDANDQIYDNVSITVTITGLPSTGVYVMELLLKDGGSWDVKDSGTGYGKTVLTYEGDIFDTGEDEWAVRVYANTWPKNSCSTAYSIKIES